MNRELANNVLSVQQLFDGRVFRVPDYQRGYAQSPDRAFRLRRTRIAARAPPCRRRPNLQRLYRSTYIDAPVATLILRAIKLAKAMKPKNSPVSARRRASLLRPSASIASIRLAFASASAPRSIKVSM